MTSRHPDWEARLCDYIASVAREPHAYGTHDCMLHCAKAATAVRGKDYARGHLKKYDSAAKAVRHMRSKGFDSPEAMLDSMFDEVPIGFAQRGDLVLTPANDETGWRIPGVVIGDLAVCVSPIGLVAEPRARWLKAWRI